MRLLLIHLDILVHMYTCILESAQVYNTYLYTLYLHRGTIKPFEHVLIVHALALTNDGKFRVYSCSLLDTPAGSRYHPCVGASSVGHPLLLCKETSCINSP